MISLSISHHGYQEVLKIIEMFYTYTSEVFIMIYFLGYDDNISLSLKKVLLTNR